MKNMFPFFKWSQAPYWLRNQREGWSGHQCETSALAHGGTPVLHAIRLNMLTWGWGVEDKVPADGARVFARQ